MLKKFRIPALALVAATVTTVMPAVSQARDRDDNRRRGGEQHQTYRPVYQQERQDRDRDFHAYAAPRGYFDRFGVWHSYGYR